MHPLDNPIHGALTTRQAHLGDHHPPASKFHSEISILGGFAEREAGLPALATLLAPGERVGVFMDEPPTTSAFTVVASAPLLQMIHDGEAPTTHAVPEIESQIVSLTEADAAEMIALAQLTKPGPFNRRTPEMGEFVGIRVGGALAAMAGQRLRVPGHIELSAICTHPDHIGRGFGAALTHWQVSQILAAGERPFLHVRGDNDRAIGLYARLGFAPRLRSRYFILQRSA